MLKRKALLLEILAAMMIVGLALFLRLYRLDASPRGALIDEAHFGYIAQSLLKTGRDEHGLSWPLVFKGFGDQKLPGYAYFLLPFVAVFNLSVFSIRVPSALIGVASVIAMMFLAKKSRFEPRDVLLAGLIMAVSPWSFFLSRFGFESNLAVFFWILGLIGIVHITQRLSLKKSWWIVPIATGVALALTWYCYIAYRPITVILLLGLTFFVAAQRRPQLRSIGLVWVSFLIAVLPLFHPAVRAANSARLQQVGIFSDEHQVVMIDESRTFCAQHLPLKVCSVVWNKGTYAIGTVTSRFFHTYSPEFLATYGEANERFLTVQGFGQFVVVLYPFFILGLIWLFTKINSWTVTEGVIATGLLITPLPSILAGEPQKVRISALLPCVVLTMLLGVKQGVEIWNSLQWSQFWKKWIGYAVVAGISLFFLTASASYFINYYTVHTVKNDYQYESYLRDLFPYLQQNFPESLIYVKPFFSDPTMFYAFYTNMSPQQYQRQAVLGPKETSGFQHTIAIDKMKVWDSGFTSAACDAVLKHKPSVYVTNEQAPHGVLLKEIKSENGALTYAFVYDALRSGKLNVQECNDLTPAQRDAVTKELKTTVTVHSGF